MATEKLPETEDSTVTHRRVKKWSWSSRREVPGVRDEMVPVVRDEMATEFSSLSTVAISLNGSVVLVIPPLRRPAEVLSRSPHRYAVRLYIF